MKFNEAFVQYALLAELGYEVAQSNAAFMLDRNEVPMLNTQEALVRALLYWGRAAAHGYSAAMVRIKNYKIKYNKKKFTAKLSGVGGNLKIIFISEYTILYFLKKSGV